LEFRRVLFRSFCAKCALSVAADQAAEFRPTRLRSKSSRRSCRGKGFPEHYERIYQIKIWDDVEMISDASRDLQTNEKIDLNKFLIYYDRPQSRGNSYVGRRVSRGNSF